MLTVNTSRPTTSAGRISRVETLTLGTQWRDFSFIRLHTDEGLSGVGEITHPTREREICMLAQAMATRHLIGADPFDTEEIWLRLYQGDFSRGGEMGGIVVSGVDQALHDLMGKALGVPVYRLVGGACRDRVPVYANGWYKGPREPEVIAKLAREQVGHGYRALKLDPFGTTLGELDRAELRTSIAIVEAVRDAVGPDVELFVEGHARFVLATAQRVARELEPFDIGWFEEPLPWTQITLYPEVRRHTSVPIAGGEHFHNRFDYAPLFEHQAVDIVQPDISLAGGYTELRKIAAIADMRSMLVAPHNSNSPLGTTASVHAAFGITNLKIVETFDGTLEPFVFDAIKGALPVFEGHVELPDRPGLGIELVDEVLDEHPALGGFWNLFAPGWEERKRQ